MTRTESGLRVEPRIGTEEQRLPLETVHAHRQPSARHRLVGRVAGLRPQPATTRTRPRRPGHAGRRQAAGLPPDGDGRCAPPRRGAIPACPGSEATPEGGGRLERSVRRAAQGQAAHRGPHHSGRRRPSDRVDLVARGAKARGGGRACGAPGAEAQRSAEDAIIEAATAVVRSVPELFERTSFGERLAPEALARGHDGRPVRRRPGADTRGHRGRRDRADRGGARLPGV